MSSDRFQAVIQRIDQLNHEDPAQDLVGGTAYPREYLYSQRLTEWVLRLDPSASEELRIAARGQHIRRWTIPRDRYERTRRGYLRWREVLKAFHADQVAQIMSGAGYPAETVGRVRLLILKKQLPHDPDTQTLEDALCLVFLETQFDDLRRKTPEDKMVEILRKTWGKMSARGRSVALQLPLSAEGQALIQRALSAP